MICIIRVERGLENSACLRRNFVQTGGPAPARRAEALNFLDFLLPFVSRQKEEPVRLKDIKANSIFSTSPSIRSERSQYRCCLILGDFSSTPDSHQVPSK